MLHVSQFRARSFDCYGTLVDWETGIWGALAPLRQRCSEPVDRAAALAAFARHESAFQAAAPTAGYPDALAAVHCKIAEDWRLPVDPALDAVFGQSLRNWPPFPDSEEALRCLRQHFRLIILSNVDRAGFTTSARQLGIEFDAIYTAEDIKSYKPDPRNFRYLKEHCGQDFGIAAEEILHVAQSLFHDHVPARQEGLATAWIDRQQGQPGATQPVTTRPDVTFMFPDLAALAARHRKELEAR